MFIETEEAMVKYTECQKKLLHLNTKWKLVILWFSKTSYIQLSLTNHVFQRLQLKT